MLRATMAVVPMDSMGSSGTIGPGDLQWMTAGSGIIHEEMPLRSPNGVRSFQLWVNLPRSEKMSDPADRGVLASEVPRVAVPGGEVLVLTGRFGDAEGPIAGIVRAPTYLDVLLEAAARTRLDAPAGETTFVQVYGGSLSAGGAAAVGADSGLPFGEGRGSRLVVGGGVAPS